MLLAECWRWGADEAAVRALLPAADAALAWAENYGDRDGDGFIEYHRATDRGLINQGWKDSFDGINDAAGHTAESADRALRGAGLPVRGPAGPSRTRRAFGDATAAARPASAPTCCGAVPRRVLAARAGLVCDRAGRSQTPYRRADQQRRPLPVDGHRDRRARRGDRRPAVPRGDGLRVRPTHTGDDDGRLQPDELPQRLGLAARHRDQRSPVCCATATSRARCHSPNDSRSACSTRRRVRRPVARALLRLPALQFRSPVPYPTSCSPQAWASAAPLLLVRSFLGLHPHVPHRPLVVSPHLPWAWGRVALTDLRLGGMTVHVQAEGETVTTRGLPSDWQLVTPSG